MKSVQLIYRIGLVAIIGMARGLCESLQIRGSWISRPTDELWETWRRFASAARRKKYDISPACHVTVRFTCLSRYYPNNPRHHLTHLVLLSNRVMYPLGAIEGKAIEG